MDHQELVRLYGPWAARTPADAVALFEGYTGRWWIAGGWAIEAFTGVSRPHGDIDPSIPRTDVDALIEHVRGRLDVWAADRGALRPLIPGGPTLSASCSNLWLRASGRDPWEFDVILMDIDVEADVDAEADTDTGTDTDTDTDAYTDADADTDTGTDTDADMEAADGLWRYKRDPRVTLPFAQILWQREGVSYLRPEIQLLHKAPGLRDQDQADFDVTRPLLDVHAQTWLRSALQLAHPGHPWIEHLAG